MAISTYIVSDILTAINKAKLNSNSALPNYTSVVPKVPHVFNRNLRILQPKEKVTFSADLVNLAGLTGSHTSGDVNNFKTFDYDLVVAYVEGSGDSQSFVIAEQGDRGYFIKFLDAVQRGSDKVFRFSVLTDSNPELQIVATDLNTYFIDTYSYDTLIEDSVYGVAKAKLPYDISVSRIYLDDDELESVFEIKPSRVLTDIEESKLKKTNYAYSYRSDSTSNLRVYGVVDYANDTFTKDGVTSISNLKGLLKTTSRETPYAMLVGTLPMSKGILLNSEIVGKSTAATVLTDVVGGTNLQTYTCSRAMQKFPYIKTQPLTGSAFITVFKEGDIDTQVGSLNISAEHLESTLLSLGLLATKDVTPNGIVLQLKRVFSEGSDNYFVQVTDSSVHTATTEGDLRAIPFESTETFAKYSLAPVNDQVQFVKPARLSANNQQTPLTVYLNGAETVVDFQKPNAYLTNRRQPNLEAIQTILYKNGIDSYISYTNGVLNINRAFESHINLKIKSEASILTTDSYDAILEGGNVFSIALNPLYANNLYEEAYSQVCIPRVVLDTTKVTSLTIRPFSRVEGDVVVSEQSVISLTQANYLTESLANTTLVNIKPLFKDGVKTNLVEITAQGGIVQNTKVVNTLFSVNPEAIITQRLVGYAYQSKVALSDSELVSYDEDISTYRGGYTYLEPTKPVATNLTFKLKSDEDYFTVRIRDVKNALLETIGVYRTTESTEFLNISRDEDTFTLTLKPTVSDSVYSASVNRTYIDDISSNTELLFIEQFAFFKMSKEL